MTSHYPDRCFTFDQFVPLSIRPCHGSCLAPRKRPARLRAASRRSHGIRYFHGCFSLGDDQPRRARRPPDRAHPFGHGREAYVWSLFAALGLFVAGAAVSVTHGIQELIHPEPAERFVVGYVVLAVSFVLEGISFLQSARQARSEAESLQRDVIEHVIATSDPTLRAVFAEDSAALTGLVIAAAGLGAHQLTGSPVPDAVGSILVGVLLGVVAVLLINRNRRFLVGEEADPRVRSAAIRALLEMPEVARAAHPDEIAPSYVFFASGRLSSYYSGEVLAPIGGETLPG